MAKTRKSYIVLKSLSRPKVSRTFILFYNAHSPLKTKQAVMGSDPLLDECDCFFSRIDGMA